MTETFSSVFGKQIELSNGTPWFMRVVDTFDSPHWIDGNKRDCKHTPEEYIGTIEYIAGRGYLEARDHGSRYMDIYVRSDNEVCLRHSNGEGDYSGIPSVASMVGVPMAEYEVALRMILEKKFPRL